MKILVVSPESLKNDTVIDENVDNKLLLDAIAVAQERRLRYILGDAFYKSMLIKIGNNTLSTKERELLDDYIVPYLILESKAEAILAITYKMRGRGVLKNSNDNGEILKNNELIDIYNYTRNAAVGLGNRLIAFLLENKPFFNWKSKVRFLHNLPISL